MTIDKTWASDTDWVDSEDEGKLIEIELLNGTCVIGVLESIWLYPIDTDYTPMFVVVTESGEQYPFEVHNRWRFCGNF